MDGTLLNARDERPPVDGTGLILVGDTAAPNCADGVCALPTADQSAEDPGEDGAGARGLRL